LRYITNFYSPKPSTNPGTTEISLLGAQGTNRSSYGSSLSLSQLLTSKYCKNPWDTTSGLFLLCGCHRGYTLKLYSARMLIYTLLLCVCMSCRFSRKVKITFVKKFLSKRRKTQKADPVRIIERAFKALTLKPYHRFSSMCECIKVRASVATTEPIHHKDSDNFYLTPVAICQPP